MQEPYREIQSPRFEVRTKLVCVTNEGLVFHSTAQALRLINSLSDGKTKIFGHSPRICRLFSEKLFFTKLVQNHFPRFSVDFQMFPNIVRKLTKNLPQNNCLLFLSKHFPEFYNFRKFSRILRQFWSTCFLNFV